MTDAIMQAVPNIIAPGEKPRSLCPINLSLEVFGDKWTLLILRDMIFADKRHFRELLQSDERISSNILADRLKMLMERGLVTKADDPTHKQKAVYSLTEKGIALVPVLAQIGAWGRRFLSASRALSVRAQLLEEGGPSMWHRLMSELRKTHLGVQADEPKARLTSVANIRRAAGESRQRRQNRKRRRA
jgi:DNA-binding HxlR family transcriptional regulator